MPYKNIIYETEDGIGIATLNRPKKMNALSGELVRELADLFLKIADDAEVKVVILTGGTEVFAAGADIDMLAGLSSNKIYGLLKQMKQLFVFIENLTKPVIAAIAGFALGGGCEISMCADLRIAADTAVFGQPEISIGVIPGAGGTQRLPRLIGLTKAKELVYTGNFINAQEALQLGLVNKVVVKDSLLDEAKKLARVLMKKPPISLSMAKAAINAGVNMDLNDALEFELLCFANAFATEDAKEGLVAFKKKRLPEFKGK